jgi:hypothetical protein
MCPSPPPLSKVFISLNIPENIWVLKTGGEIWTVVVEERGLHNTRIQGPGG